MSLATALTDLTDFYTFRAFRPAHDDVLRPLSARLKGKAVGFLSLGDAGVTMGTIVFDKLGDPSFKGFTYTACDVGEAMPMSMLADLKKLSPSGLVIVSYGRAGELAIRVNAPSRTDEAILNQQLSENPERLINGYNPGYAYSGINHPSESTLLHINAETRKIEELIYALSGVKLTSVRIVSSHLSLLDMVLAHTEVRAGTRGVVVYDQGQVYSLDCIGGRWGDAHNPPRGRKVKGAEELRGFIDEVRQAQPNLLLAATPTGVSDFSPVFADLPELLGFEIPGVNPLELTAYAASIH